MSVIKNQGPSGWRQPGGAVEKWLKFAALRYNEQCSGQP